MEKDPEKITRQDISGAPSSGRYLAQRMTPEETVRGYTVWSAHAGFDEYDASMISLGKRAALTVLNVDPFRAAGPALLRGHVVVTVSRGRQTYQR